MKKESIVVFIEKSPYMSVELLNKFEKYKIISFYKDSLFEVLSSKYCIDTFGETRLSSNLASDTAVAKILSNRIFLSKLNKKNDLLLFFFMDEKINFLAKKNGLLIALPKYSLQRTLNDKIKLIALAKKINIPINLSIKSIASKESVLNKYKDYVKKFGDAFVVQCKQGVSGENTYLVQNLKDFKKILTDNNYGGLKISKYISNALSLSVHVCILNDDILIEGPFLQVIGFKELSTNPFQFCGNSTDQYTLNQNLNKKTILEIKKIAMKIASHSRNIGYFGILGIDFLYDKDTADIYVQEINARLVGLTRLLTGIQHEQGIESHLVKHLKFFLKTYTKTPQKKINFQNKTYSQILICNNTSKSTKIFHEITPGIYMLNTLEKISDSLFISDLKKNQILITQSAYRGSLIKQNEILIRGIVKKRIFKKNNYALEKWLVILINRIRLKISKT